MAWRIDEAVMRGEIDNRVRGRVIGRIWFVGRKDPVVLGLKGNAWRDVAGRVLYFENPVPKAMELDTLAEVQDGPVGDITASRKVKVPEIPMEQIGEYYAAKKPWPWHWGNCLYLEWFSQRNGRVVIESPHFELHMAGDAAWEMTAAEEDAQKDANGQAIVAFLSRLSGALQADPAADEDQAEETDESAPMTEDDAERWQARQDLLLDRVQARLEREGSEADFECILDEERERLRIETGEPEPPAEWEPGQPDWDALVEKAAAMEPDPELEERLKFEHPLVRQAADLFHLLHEQSESEQWLPEDAQAEHPVQELINATMCIGPKLAGALNGGRWPPTLDHCAITIVRLKRAHGYVDDAITAVESCQEEGLIEPTLLGPIVVELTDIAHEIHGLITELRERLGN